MALYCTVEDHKLLNDYGIWSCPQCGGSTETLTFGRENEMKEVERGKERGDKWPDYPKDDGGQHGKGGGSAGWMPK